MAHAQSGEPIKLANVGELSGAGATVGTNFKNGVDLAAAEINAKDGVLGPIRNRTRGLARTGSKGARRPALRSPRAGFFQIRQGRVISRSAPVSLGSWEARLAN